MTHGDLAGAALRLTDEEVRSTHVLFHTRHATDLSEERARAFGYTVVYHGRILQTLRGLGLKVTPGSDPEMLFGPLGFDFVYFTQVEAPFAGHELMIPVVAAYRGVPFLGPAAPVRAVSEDKLLGKAVAAAMGIAIAEYQVLDGARPGTWGAPPPGRWILKPRTGVMSELLTLVEDEASWRAAKAAAASPGGPGRDFLLEAFVPGLNLAVPVIEGFPLDALPVFIELGEARDNILTEAGKEGRSHDYACEPYDGPGAAEASAAAARMAATLGPLDYARFDFRYDLEQRRLVFLEVNMNCAMGPPSVVARAAKLCGLDYPTLVGHIFTHSLRRQRTVA